MLEHIGVVVDMERMKVFVTDRMMERVRVLTKKLLAVASRNYRLVPYNVLRRFCGVCVTILLALPLDSFYTRSLYSDMNMLERETEGPGAEPPEKHFGLMLRAILGWSSAQHGSAYRGSRWETSDTGAALHVGSGPNFIASRRI